MHAGAIIGDGDRKRAPFLVLGLSLVWVNFLFLEQIALSPVAHACCENFCGCRAAEMESEIPEIIHAFGPQLSVLMFGGILLKFVESSSSLSEVSVEFRYSVPLYITDQAVFCCFFYKNFKFLHSKFHRYVM